MHRALQTSIYNSDRRRKRYSANDADDPDGFTIRPFLHGIFMICNIRDMSAVFFEPMMKKQKDVRWLAKNIFSVTRATVYLRIRR